MTPKPILRFLVIAGLAFGFGPTTGCKAPAPADRVARVAVVTELAAFTGTTLALKRNPALRPQFESALKGLDAITTTNGVNVVRLQEALSKLPIKELQGDSGTLIIGAAVTLYEAELARLTPIDRDSYAAVVARSVRNGLARALTPQP